jgi:hypothetical protein
MPAAMERHRPRVLLQAKPALAAPQAGSAGKAIEGVALTSNPYIGEFLKFDVVKVTRAP